MPVEVDVVIDGVSLPDAVAVELLSDVVVPSVDAGAVDVLSAQPPKRTENRLRITTAIIIFFFIFNVTLILTFNLLWVG
jgi:hypothetical protein